MDARTLFGLFAVTAMLFCYGLEGRSHWFVLAFAGACAFGSTIQLIGNHRELFGLIDSGGVHPLVPDPGTFVPAFTFNQFTHREAPQ
jgi:hypothetical protein